MIRHEDAKHYLGQEVVYKRPGVRPERGTIEGVNDAYVFVLFLGDRTAKATSAADLTFAAPGMQGELREDEPMMHEGDRLGTIGLCARCGYAIQLRRDRWTDDETGVIHEADFWYHFASAFASAFFTCHDPVPKVSVTERMSR
jgi:hypothetical protein